jgi:hypothetical protein
LKEFKQSEQLGKVIQLLEHVIRQTSFLNSWNINFLLAGDSGQRSAEIKLTFTALDVTSTKVQMVVPT